MLPHLAVLLYQQQKAVLMIAMITTINSSNAFMFSSKGVYRFSLFLSLSCILIFEQTTKITPKMYDSRSCNNYKNST